MMNKMKNFFLLATLIILTLACSFSFDADLSGNNTTPTQTGQENVANENEALENPNENNSNDDEEVVATEPGASGDVSKGGGQFPDADEVLSNPTDENEITSPAGQNYSEVQIKSGPDTFTFTEDVNDGCFEIVGIGTPTVQVNRIGDGRDCKEIGGIGLMYSE